MDWFAAEWIDWLQWPAMLATVLAAWLVGSSRKFRRNTGFWVFLASNVLWVVWGLHSGAKALIVLQLALAALNIRGVFKTETPDGAGAPRAN
jgi:Flp pilus assembly protein TadB